jgi:carbonic anhydrase/acetyltransferase-like protein (isoleucine patch superfamily)
LYFNFKYTKMSRNGRFFSTLAPFLRRSPVIPPTSWVHPSAIVEGDVKLGENVSIWPMTVIRGDVNSVSIGDKSNVQDGCVLHVRGNYEGRQIGHNLCIGDAVSIGHKACLHACIIESRTLVGIGAIILDGAVIKEGALIAAGALVPPGKVCDAGLWAGCPAKRFVQLLLNLFSGHNARSSFQAECET